MTFIFLIPPHAALFHERLEVAPFEFVPRSTHHQSRAELSYHIGHYDAFLTILTHQFNLLQEGTIEKKDEIQIYYEKLMESEEIDVEDDSLSDIIKELEETTIKGEREEAKEADGFVELILKDEPSIALPYPPNSDFNQEPSLELHRRNASTSSGRHRLPSILTRLQDPIRRSSLSKIVGIISGRSSPKVVPGNLDAIKRSWRGSLKNSWNNAIKSLNKNVTDPDDITLYYL